MTQSALADHRFGGLGMIRILIVEDTPAEADALAACLRRFGEERGEALSFEVMGSAFEFVGSNHTADLIFMDIDMPGVSGMEAAEALRANDAETPLVFVTNLAQYAVRGYEVDALGFLVKPVAYAELVSCMDRALRVLRRRAATTVRIPTPDGLRVIALRDIAYVDIFHHDLYYHLAGEPEPLRIRGSIRAAAEELGDGFVKVSASCLANMGQVRLVRQGSVVMQDGQELFFSRGCRKAALEALSNFVGGSI